MGRGPGDAHLLLCQVEELLLGLLYVRQRTPDDNRVTSGTFHREVDVDAATLLHDGADEAALGADESVVQLGGDGDLQLGDVGLGTCTEGRHGAGRAGKLLQSRSPQVSREPEQKG